MHALLFVAALAATTPDSSALAPATANPPDLNAPAAPTTTAPATPPTATTTSTPASTTATATRVDVKQDVEERPWGVGLGFAVGPGPQFNLPVTATIERRFGDNLWLGATAFGGLQYSSYDLPESTPSTSTSTLAFAGAGLSARYVFNPRSDVEVSAIANTYGVTEVLTSPFGSMFAEGNLGLAFEHHFSPAFAVRAGSPIVLVDASYAPGTGGVRASTSLDVQLALQPSLSVLFYF